MEHTFTMLVDRRIVNMATVNHSVSCVIQSGEGDEESKLLVKNRVICAENKRIVNFLLDSIKTLVLAELSIVSGQG